MIFAQFAHAPVEDETSARVDHPRAETDVRDRADVRDFEWIVKMVHCIPLSRAPSFLARCFVLIAGYETAAPDEGSGDLLSRERSKETAGRSCLGLHGSGGHRSRIPNDPVRSPASNRISRLLTLRHIAAAQPS